MDEQELTRARILGVLIQDARQHAGRTVEDCAAVLKIAPETFARAEKGEHVISLPELEVLALYLDVPMAHFWGSRTLGQPQTPNYELLLALRRKMVGAMLSHARMEAGMAVGDLADATGVAPEEIQRYEQGQEPVPILKLEKLARELSLTLDDFVDAQHGPLARQESARKRQRHFAELPPDIQEFVSAPVNRAYLETAMRLSEMDVDRLRRIAEGLLDITL